MVRCPFNLNVRDALFSCQKEAGHRGRCEDRVSANQQDDVVVSWKPGPVLTVEMMREMLKPKADEHCYGTYCHYLTERRCLCVCSPCGEAKKKDH